MSLAERLAAGDHRALAQAITQVENEDHGASELRRSLSGRGNAGDSPLLQKRMKRLIRFKMRVCGGEAF